MSNNIFNEFWDKIGYKRVLTGFLFVFGIISPGIGILLIRQEDLFVKIPMSKIVALSLAIGMPFIVANLFLGLLMAYLLFYKKEHREKVHEDKIARLTLTSSALVAALCLNALLGLVSVLECRFIDIAKIVFLVDLVLIIAFQLLLFWKVGIIKSSF